MQIISKSRNPFPFPFLPSTGSSLWEVATALSAAWSLQSRQQSQVAGVAGEDYVAGFAFKGDC